MLVWIIISFSVGFSLLVILVGIVMLIVGIAIGVQYQRKKGLPSRSEESSKNYETDLQAPTAAPEYEEVTLVGENNEIELSHNVAYGYK